ncbi:MAG: DUF58 domain-containing protein [Terriglobia bacterium]
MQASSPAYRAGLATSNKGASQFNRQRSWQLFVTAIAALATAFCFALYASDLGGDGHYEMGAAFAAASLVLLAFVAFRVVPYLARRSFGGARVEYELTREGGVYLAIIVLIAIASLNTGNNLLFIILAILLGGILASGILAKAVLSGLKIDLALPEHVFAFERVLAQVTIRNEKRAIPAYSLTVTSRDEARKRRGKRSDEDPPAGGRAAGGILTRGVYAPYISPRGSVTERVDLRFPRRGRYRQSPFQTSSKFPFSILRRKCIVPASDEILVLPAVIPAGKFTNVLSEIRGEIESQSRGRGCDLYALRDYQAGDSARHVDWKATAKSQRLKVREFTREEEVRVTIFFDDRMAPPASPASRERFERAVDFCACLAWQAYTSGSLLRFAGGKLETAMAPAGNIVYRVLEELAVIEARDRASNGADAFPPLAAGATGGFSVVITDDPLNPLFKQVTGAGRVIAMQEL